MVATDLGSPQLVNVKSLKINVVKNTSPFYPTPTFTKTILRTETIGNLMFDAAANDSDTDVGLNLSIIVNFSNLVD